jgi:DNA-binding IclR family transcriptional regulator
MHTEEIAFANERAIIADMLINLLTNLRLTYLPDLEPADAHELLLTGAHVLIAQLGSQPATASEISRVIGRSRDVVMQRLEELLQRGYVEHRGNRYKVTVKLNVPNLQRHMQTNISIIQAAARQLGGRATKSSSLSRVAAR